MEENSVSREEMTEALDNLKKEILDQIPSQNTLIEKVNEGIAPLKQEIEALKTSELHPVGLCFKDSCQPCMGHIISIVQKACRQLLDGLQEACESAGLKQEAGKVATAYQNWQRTGKPSSDGGDKSPKDKEVLFTLDLGGGEPLDIVESDG